MIKIACGFGCDNEIQLLCKDSSSQINIASLLKMKHIDLFLPQAASQIELE